MRICMMSRSVPAHGLGGMERHIGVLCRELGKLGHPVTVLTTAAPPLPDPDLPDPGDTGVEYRFLAGTTPGGYSRQWWSASRKALAQERPDVVHSQSIGAYGVLSDIKKRKLPLVATSHGTPVSDAATDLRTHGPRLNPAQLFNTLRRMPHHMQVYGRADRIIAVSRPIAEHLVKYSFAPRSKTTVVLNGIDTDFFNPGQAAADRERLWGSSGPVIFSIARVVKDKGFHFLIKAMPAVLKEHPGALLVVGGEGPYLPELKALAGREGVGKAVRFTGRIPEAELPAHYRSCDLFALATTFVEGFGLVIAEAMACGRPAAASDIGGVPEVVRDGVTGRLFPPGDQKNITGTLLELLSDERALKAMGMAARDDAVKRFGAGRMARETAAVYSAISSG